jgi:hypothetical protein
LGCGLMLRPWLDVFHAHHDFVSLHVGLKSGV